MGPIFKIDKTFYFVEHYNLSPSKIHTKFNLEEQTLVNNLNIPFENIGGYDSSLTYHPELNALITVNNANIYKYSVNLE